MANKSVVYKKISHVRHNLSRLREKNGISLENLKTDLDAQDIILHNLQLAIRGCIDIGAHILADQGWGVVGSVNETFYILQDMNVIPPELAEKMVAMVGFRNILVHEYETINFEIVHNIIGNRLTDIEEFLLAVVHRFNF